MHRQVLIVSSDRQEARRIEEIFSQNSGVTSRYHLIKVGTVQEAKDAILQLQETIAFIICDTETPFSAYGKRINNNHQAAEQLRYYLDKMGLDIKIITVGNPMGDSLSGDDLPTIQRGDELQILNTLFSLQQHPAEKVSRTSGSGEKLAALNERVKGFATQEEFRSFVYGGKDNPKGFLDQIGEIEERLKTIESRQEEILEALSILRALILAGSFLNKIGAFKYLLIGLAMLAGSVGMGELLNFIGMLLENSEAE